MEASLDSPFSLNLNECILNTIESLKLELNIPFEWDLEVPDYMKTLTDTLNFLPESWKVELKICSYGVSYSSLYCNLPPKCEIQFNQDKWMWLEDAEIYLKTSEDYLKLSFEKLWWDFDSQKELKFEENFIIIQSEFNFEHFICQAVNCTTEVYSKEKIFHEIYGVSHLDGQLDFPSILENGFSNKSLM